MALNMAESQGNHIKQFSSHIVTTIHVMELLVYVDTF